MACTVTCALSPDAFAAHCVSEAPLLLAMTCADGHPFRAAANADMSAAVRARRCPIVRSMLSNSAQATVVTSAMHTNAV